MYAHRRKERDRNVIGKNCCHFPDNFGMMKLATIRSFPSHLRPAQLNEMKQCSMIRSCIPPSEALPRRHLRYNIYFYTPPKNVTGLLAKLGAASRDQNHGTGTNKQINISTHTWLLTLSHVSKKVCVLNLEREKRLKDKTREDEQYALDNEKKITSTQLSGHFVNFFDFFFFLEI